MGAVRVKSMPLASARRRLAASTHGPATERDDGIVRPFGEHLARARRARARGTSPRLRIAEQPSMDAPARAATRRVEVDERRP